MADPIVNIEARVIIREVNDGSAPISDYSTAKQKFEGESKERNVLIHRFTTNMQKLFTVRKPFDHKNIQKVFDFVPFDGKCCMMTCEKVDINLSTWLKQPRGFQNNRSKILDCDALICRFMRQSTRAINYLHKNGYYYGSLSCDDLYLSFDRRYKPTDVKYYNLKLTLPKFEKRLMEKPDGIGTGIEAIVWQGLASVLKLWVLYLEPKRLNDFDMLEWTLNNCISFDEKQLNCQHCMWYDIKKIQFITLMSPLPAACSNLEIDGRNSFSAEVWTVAFTNHIGAVGTFLRSKGQNQKRYTDSLDDFVDFMAKTFRHYLEYPQEVLAYLGNTEVEVLHNFERFYPSLFKELRIIADRVNKLDGFANDTY